jgi:hypothetical protein
MNSSGRPRVTRRRPKVVGAALAGLAMSPCIADGALRGGRLGYLHEPMRDGYRGPVATGQVAVLHTVMTILPLAWPSIR